MKKILLPLALSALMASGALAQSPFDPASMDAAQKEAFGQAVREYLLNNPQVIMEAVAVLEQREQQQKVTDDAELVARNWQALNEDGFSYVGGNPDGDVTVIEFLDYRCGYCRKAHPEVEQLIESDGNIRLIVKEFPILGEASLMFSKFAVATHIVAGDEAYALVHDALIALESAPNEAVLSRLAKTLGLDDAAILAEMESEEVARRLATTRALAQELQINGTPSFVFGEHMLRGYAPLETMQKLVAGIRQ